MDHWFFQTSQISGRLLELEGHVIFHRLKASYLGSKKYIIQYNKIYFLNVYISRNLVCNTCCANWINSFTYQHTRCLEINDKCPVSSVQCQKRINSILTARGRARGIGLIFPFRNVWPRGAKNSGVNKNFSKIECLATCILYKSEKSCYCQNV